MKVSAEPDFKRRIREPRYFVRQLDPNSYGYNEGYRYEVQLLSETGQGGACILFCADEPSFVCPEYPVPEAVFRAALARRVGDGEYVTSNGEPRPVYWARPEST